MAKSNTSIPSADVCQLHGAHSNWESDPLIRSQKFLPDALIFTVSTYPCQRNHTSVLWLPVFLALGDFKHHLWFRTHSHVRICSKVTQRLRGGRRTTAAASSHKMSVGRHRWHRPRHNLSLIIYTVGLTVLMQRPEKIQPTNLICTQQP